MIKFDTCANTYEKFDTFVLTTTCHSYHPITLPYAIIVLYTLPYTVSLKLPEIPWNANSVQDGICF